MEPLSPSLKPALAELLLSIADDKFILGHRNADWTGLAPILEEDIAFSSLAQDDLAHASALYQFVGDLLGRDENQLAYGRTPEEYRCAALVELPDEFDWAVAICRQFFCDHFDMLRLTRLAASSHPPLAALAARLVAEERIHIGHSDSWVIRLGQAGSEARDRMQSAIDKLAPLAPALFEPTPGLDALEQSGVYPGTQQEMLSRWSAALYNVTGSADLRLTLAPLASGFVGGRQGRHSETFRELLDEMTEVFRIEPGAAW